MVIKIRLGVFETNSSSTHSIAICSDEELEKWKAGELLYDYTNSTLVSVPEEDCYRYKTFEEFKEYLEVDYHTYVTKNGEKLNIICRYGYDS